MPRGNELFDPGFVRGLFDEMSQTYGLVNFVSSLGFTIIWRRACVRAGCVRRGDRIADLMTGMGELCPDLAKASGRTGHIYAIDISPAMCEQARQRGAALAKRCPVEVVEGDALDCHLEDGSVDRVLSSFGLKTFSPEQHHTLALQVARILKPGGTFSFLEISTPPYKLILWPYMIYVRFLIPLIGWVFMGNPDNYRLLWRYTALFGSCRTAQPAFEQAGLVVHYRSHFFGCASSLYGHKPDP